MKRARMSEMKKRRGRDKKRVNEQAGNETE